VKLRPRLLPIVIVAAIGLLGMKVADLVSGGAGAVASAALAQATTPANSTPTGAPVDLTKQANDPSSKQAPNSDAQALPDVMPAAGPQTASAPPADSPSTDSPAASATPPRAAPAKDPLLLSPSEISILQQLSDRHAQLDQQAADLSQREALLQAAEKRVDDKIAKLADMQKAIADADAKRQSEEDARTKSLVKVYETMKPADAAQILEQLDMPVALTLIGHMKESKTAPVLAAMSPAKAKAITTALAATHSPPDAAPGAAPTP
jgi:flagellar motility protein MotE (MotC chaperone)